MCLRFRRSAFQNKRAAAQKFRWATTRRILSSIKGHSGWRFTDDAFHDIGTTTTHQGRGREVKNESLNFAFKTPTLRSVALRAPYMHDASIPTLADVVRHYENGGIDRPSRSRLMVPIQLSDQEQLDLVAFMESLTGEAARPGA